MMRTWGIVVVLWLAGPALANGPKLVGEIKLRLEDGRSTLPAEDTPAYVKALWYGPELKDATLFNFSARLGVQGRLSPLLAYGARLMFRNFKAPAFTFPAFEPGFGNTTVVADQFYLTLNPLDELTISLGKHPMLTLRHPNFFWDADVQPVGASEQYKMSFWSPESNNLEHTVGLNASQWFPTVSLRDFQRTVIFGFQGFYQLNIGGETGWSFEGAVGTTQMNGFNRFLASSAIGGSSTTTLRQNADGTYSLITAPKSDFTPVNDATLIGHNPLWIDVYLAATMKNLAGRPLMLRVGYVHNGRATRPNATFAAPNTNAWQAGLTYGKVKKRWSWSVGYHYIAKGVASVVSDWTDESWGSDLKGHMLNAELGITEGASVSLQWRFMQDADGLDKTGQPLPDNQRDASFSNLKLMFAASF